jgi:hypothetical protein
VQLKNQVRKNWKVVAAVTAASAIGVSGLAFADPGNGSNDPNPIDLKDRTEITQVTTETSFPGVSFNTLLSATDTDTNSPFDDTTTGTFDSMSATASPDTESLSASLSPDTATVSPDTVSADSASDSFDNSVDS